MQSKASAGLSSGRVIATVSFPNGFVHVNLTVDTEEWT
jgi:hypothetical protein